MRAVTDESRTANVSSGIRRRKPRGVLRVYLGAAPGVGKTAAMLGEGNAAGERGVDVVVGLVETHGRDYTAQMRTDWRSCPRRVEHRGIVLGELDVDAVLARRPSWSWWTRWRTRTPPAPLARSVGRTSSPAVRRPE